MLTWESAAEATRANVTPSPAPLRLSPEAPKAPLQTSSRPGSALAPQPSTLDRTVAHFQMRAKDPLGALGMSATGRMVALPGERAAAGGGGGASGASPREVGQDTASHEARDSGAHDAAAHDAAAHEGKTEAPRTVPEGGQAPLQMACSSGCECAACGAAKHGSLLLALGIQREARPGAGPPTVDAGEVRSRLGSGAPLPGPVEQRFSRAYGHDLSGVRVHANHTLANDLGARAFTVGRDVAFAPGEYRPGTPAGDRLIGHELAHVVQQSGGTGTVQGAGLSEDAYEHEADLAADEALAGQRAARFSAVGRGGPQRAVQKKGFFERVGDGLSAAGGALVDTGKAAAGAVADTVGDVAEAGWDALVEQLWSLVRAIAPAAEPYLRNPGRLWDVIKEALSKGIDALVGGVFGALPQGGLFGAVSTFFKSFVPAVTRLAAAIAKDDHAGIVAAVQGAIEAFSQMSDTALAPLQAVFKTISGGLKKAFDALGKPLLDLLKKVAKGAWTLIEGFVADVQAIGKKVGSALSKVWSSIKSALGLGGDDSKEGLWDRIKKWAEGLWEKAKPTVMKFVEPLKTLGKLLLVLSPAGPMILTLKYGPKVVRWFKEVWSAIKDPQNIPRARANVVSALHGASAFLQGAAAAMSGLAGQINAALEGISKPLAQVVDVLGVGGFLKLLAAGAQLLARLIEGGIKWVADNVPPFVKAVSDFFTKVWSWARPILDVVVKIAVVVGNPLGLWLLAASWAWGRAPKWLKVVIISFVLDLMIRFVSAMPDAVLVVGIGPLGALIKHAILGFLKELYGNAGANVDKAVAAADRIAKLAGGGGIDFALGFGKGLLVGIWDGIFGPVELAVMVIDGVAKVAEWLDKVSQSLPDELKGIFARAKALGASVKGAFWPAVKSVFSGQGGGFQRVLGALKGGWDAITGGAGKVGAAIASAMRGFLSKPDFELGEKIGWVAGMVVFEVALAALTGGASAALAAAKGPIAAILRLIVKVHKYMGKVFEEVLHHLPFIQRALGKVMKALGELPGVKQVVAALERLFAEIEAAGARAIGKLGGEATEKAASLATKAEQAAVGELGEAAGKAESAAAKAEGNAAKAEGDAAKAESNAAKAEEPAAGKPKAAPEYTGHPILDPATGKTHTLKVFDDGRLMMCSECAEFAEQLVHRATMAEQGLGTAAADEITDLALRAQGIQQRAAGMADLAGEELAKAKAQLIADAQQLAREARDIAQRARTPSKLGEHPALTEEAKKLEEALSPIEAGLPVTLPAAEARQQLAWSRQTLEKQIGAMENAGLPKSAIDPVRARLKEVEALETRLEAAFADNADKEMRALVLEDVGKIKQEASEIAQDLAAKRQAQVAEQEVAGMEALAARDKELEAVFGPGKAVSEMTEAELKAAAARAARESNSRLKKLATEAIAERESKLSFERALEEAKRVAAKDMKGAKGNYEDVATERVLKGEGVKGKTSKGEAGSQHIWANSEAEARAIQERLKKLLGPKEIKDGAPVGKVPDFHGPEGHRGIGHAPDARHFNAEGYYDGVHIDVHIYY